MKSRLAASVWAIAIVPMCALVGCIKSEMSSQPATNVKGQPQPAQNKPQMPAPKQEGPKLGEPSRGGGVVAGGGNAASMAVRRGADNATIRNDLHQLGILYKAYVAENGNGPRSLDDFLNYIQRDAQAIHKRFKDQVYTLNLLAKSTGDSVVVFETDAFAGDGMRNVLMGDGSVKKMNEAELKQGLGKR